VRKALADRFLELAGWSPEGTAPDVPKYVLIAAPHTSNWDLLWMLLFAAHFGVSPRFMAKHTLFRGPMGWAMRGLGGIPVERRRAADVVAQSVAAFTAAEALALVVPAEGTRSRAPFWKSGFYRIAREAGVPIVPSFLDYGRRTGGFGEPFHPTGDVRADMDRLRVFYAGRTGKYPALFGEVRLREEDAEAGGRYEAASRLARESTSTASPTATSPGSTTRP
jgi:1-acyl-sn-glycerol-3-phosphate acyltransferase